MTAILNMSGNALAASAAARLGAVRKKLKKP
jgi:hypothetical protein